MTCYILLINVVNKLSFCYQLSQEIKESHKALDQAADVATSDRKQTFIDEVNKNRVEHIQSLVA